MFYTEVLHLGLADLCDRALVQCVAAEPHFFHHQQSQQKLDTHRPHVLEWAALAGKCDLQAFAPYCEMYIINHFPSVSWSTEVQYCCFLLRQMWLWLTAVCERSLQGTSSWCI